MEYAQVEEHSSTDPDLMLFGAPVVNGDSLLFSPTGFGVSASNGSSDRVSATLSTIIQAADSHYIERIQFSQRGDYTLAGSGTSATNCSAAALLRLQVLAVDGNDLAEPLEHSESFIFTPWGGAFNLLDHRGTSVIWNSQLDVALAPLLSAAGIHGMATRVSVSLENELSAYSQSGTLAYIKNKQIEGMTLTAVSIPEPGALSVLAMLAGALLRRSR